MKLCPIKEKLTYGKHGCCPFSLHFSRSSWTDQFAEARVTQWHSIQKNIQLGIWELM